MALAMVVAKSEPCACCGVGVLAVTPFAGCCGVLTSLGWVLTSRVGISMFFVDMSFTTRLLVSEFPTHRSGLVSGYLYWTARSKGAHAMR